MVFALEIILIPMVMRMAQKKMDLGIVEKVAKEIISMIIMI